MKGGGSDGGGGTGGKRGGGEEGEGRDGECRRVRGEALVGSDGGGAHLGSLLPMSIFVCRQSFLCAGGCLHSQALFSFACSHLCSWVVVFIRVCAPSPLFVGRHLCLWVFAFVHGCSCSLVGDHLCLWVVMPFVWCCGGHSCSFVGGHHCRRLHSFVGSHAVAPLAVAIYHIDWTYP